MNRSLVPCLVFTLCLSAAAVAQPASPVPAESSTPAWLPRGALLGTFIRGGAVAPQVRLQWQGVFYRSRTDSLGLLLEPTAAVALVKPDTVTSLQFYSLVLGLGYTSRRPSGIEWGFQFGTGPLWYSARLRGVGKDRESYFVGLLDGRARMGYRLGSVSLGVSVGYGDIYNYRRLSLARSQVGGLQLGLYADWR